MVINVCITVAYGNYLCLNNHYVYLLIPSLFCLKKIRIVQFYYQHPPAVNSGTVDMSLLTNHKSPH